ncbi:hypothetical protein [Streptomyces sp. NPDC056291]|uniref:hypothetical protein n=1 Tax=Streptomyces sp. NPDC056291 TaxID=3345772 RepID=UPI0035E10D19
MPVEPLPCNPEPEPVTPPCCAPSIASAPLCRSDGTTVLAVVRSGCGECGQAAEDPAVVGWLDTAGTFTAGALPDDAGPCETGCVDTVCRSLCDDTDGDGLPDATYSELWCIRANGVAELVLTYQGDPSQEYVPVSPVECAYGCPESETVPLCDTAPDGTVTPFLRRYRFLNGTATYEDVALDGQTAYVVTGAVGSCDNASPCAEQTTPAATLGLCLADGTPIAVIVTRDCDGTVTRDGWLNLTTGAWSAGAPPAGTIACGDSRSITTNGTFCDVLADGTVVGLVLVEYQYAADGSIAAVRLVDAVTGATYVPQGEVTTCPAGVEQPERDLVQLCDIAADGSSTPFVRDYARNENGQIVGHSDYTLDGAPYAPAGEVDVCPLPGMVVCGLDPDDPNSGVVGSITTGTDVDPSTTFLVQPDPVSQQPSMGLAKSLGGVDSVIPPWTKTTNCGSSGQANGWQAVRLPAVPRPSCDDGTVTVTIEYDLRNDGPTNSAGGWVNVRLVSVSGGVETTHNLATGGNAPAVGVTKHLVNTATIPAAILAAGDLYWDIRIETRQSGCKGWTVRNVDASFEFGIAGCTDQPQYAQLVRLCEPIVVPPAIPEPEHDLVVLCDTDPDTGVATPFVRNYLRDASGLVVAATDTTLDGAPYTPAGTVGVCPAESACADCTTHILCDVPPDTSTAALPPGAVPGTLSNGVGYSVANATSQFGQPWWLMRTSPITWTFSQPVAVRFGIQLRQNGTCAVLPEGATPVTLAPVHTWDAATRTLCTTAPNNDTSITTFTHPGLTELAVGHSGAGAAFSKMVGEISVTPVTTTFERTTCRDCSGAVTSVTDTLLDGTTAYTPTGAVGVCLPEQPEAEPCRDTSNTLLCDTTTTEAVTVFDPANVTGPDGWQVVSFTGAQPGYGPTGAMPYAVYQGTNNAGQVSYGARPDLNAGPTSMPWPGYDNAPVRWVIRKEFTAPEDGTATLTATGFRADGGGRVWINGVDMGLYSQWGQPGVGGGGQAPVTAGPNVIEIEVRDDWGFNWVTGRLDIVMTQTVQFMRRQTMDCETGDVIATHDTTQSGEPYTVTGEVGTCQPVTECCPQQNTETLALCDTAADGTVTAFLRHLTHAEGGGITAVVDTLLDGATTYTPTGDVGVCDVPEPPPETRFDVETALLCVRDQASGEITGQVIAERVYDDQSGDLIEQRLTDLDGDPYTLPAGAELTKCPSPDRITRQVCVVESGRSEFLTNAANATSGVDTDWQWAPSLTGFWHPMYRVAPNAVWTATDTAPNKAHWVSPHANRTVCPTAGETSPPVPGTWYTRASWNLPANVDPDSIRIAATVLNADNKVVQWRLNDGAWQPVGGGALTNPAWTFPPTAVPGGRAGQNEVVVQILETAPAASCPSPNEAGMILHVIATYDYEPRVWTQVIEPGGQVYYLDENGDRQDSIPAGQRLVPCGSGGDAACCPEEPCGDTELTQLCDLVYSPAPPIPLPAGTFTLTGNVQAGAALAYSTGDTPPNGIATRTVSGLLPGSAYQFRFSTSWGGVGAPNPTANSAVYLVEVLDGSTVIASQTRNITNGAGQTPGFVAEVPVQFMAPATGAVTVRISDRSPGAATNRDLVVLPEDVRSDVLTVQSTPFLRAIVFDCDGVPTAARDLALDGTSLYEVRGEVGTCSGDGSGGGGAAPGPDTEVVQLCDVAGDGSSTPFLRQLTFQPGEDTPTVTDTALDGVTPYSPAGTVGTCQSPGEGRDVELTPMCVIDNVTGRVVQQILAEVTYDTATGDRLSVRYVDPLTWGPVAVPGGTHLDLCPSERQPDPTPDAEVVQLCDLVDGQEPTPFLRHLIYVGSTTPTVVDTALDGTSPYVLAGTAGACSTPCDVQAVIEACRCDDTTGDGEPDTGYVELLTVDCEGQLTSIGTYTPGLTEPYTPVSPVDCDEADEGAEPAFGVQARRVELAAGQTWDASAWPTLQSVTAIAHGGTGTVTTADGASTLHTGEAATWSVGRDVDARLTGPLSITADTGTGTVTVTWTEGVQL